MSNNFFGEDEIVYILKVMYYSGVVENKLETEHYQEALDLADKLKETVPDVWRIKIERTRKEWIYGTIRPEQGKPWK